jgi:hypothetical protein
MPWLGKEFSLAVRPQPVIGIRHADFTGAPTRWAFA